MALKIVFINESLKFYRILNLDQIACLVFAKCPCQQSVTFWNIDVSTQIA